MEVRNATKDDWGAFAEMWKEYLSEILDSGGDILPTEKTMEFFRKIFDSYVSGSLLGSALIVDDVGVLLWGASADPPVFDTTLDPVAFGWGTYVRPDHRRSGVSTAIREAGKSAMRDFGYRSIVGTILGAEYAGKSATLAYGFVPNGMNVVLDLGGME